MKKRIFGRKFKKTVNQRKALFRSLMHAMILNDRIKTTEAKAKAVRGEIEKLVTKAAKKGEDSRNTLKSRLVQDEVVNKLISEIGPRFANRPGGYTRIIRLGTRLKDNSEMVLLEWVDYTEISTAKAQAPKTTKKATKEQKKVAKKEKQLPHQTKQNKDINVKQQETKKAHPTTTMRRTGSRGK